MKILNSEGTIFCQMTKLELLSILHHIGCSNYGSRIQLGMTPIQSECLSRLFQELQLNSLHEYGINYWGNTIDGKDV